MFDDLNNKSDAGGGNESKINEPSGQNLATPSSRPVPAEDIFADVEKNNKPEAFRPKAESNLPQPNESEQTVSKENKKFLYIFIGLLVVVFLLIIGFFVFNAFISKDIDKIIDEQAGDLTDGIIDSEINSEGNVLDDKKAEEEPEIIIQTEDSDMDGLTDDEENLAGSDINKIDTDEDGLFDREEVKVYLTDPTNPDSDGDGYLDGDEVKNGYNPRGDGKLY